MKKVFIFFFLSVFFACQKQNTTVFETPECVQIVINTQHIIDTNSALKISQYELEQKDYYLFVFGSLDNGVGFLLNNQCDTICKNITDDLSSCSLLSKAKFIKTLYE